MTSPKRPPEPRRSRSGPTRTNAQRRAAGLVRVIVWLSEEEAEVLDALAEGSTRRDAIGQLLRPRQGTPRRSPADGSGGTE